MYKVEKARQEKKKGTLNRTLRDFGGHLETSLIFKWLDALVVPSDNLYNFASRITNKTLSEFDIK
jgi:hypothetical protein